MNVEPVTLVGKHVRMEPLTLDHVDALCEVGLDAELWRLTPQPVETRKDMTAYVTEALLWQEAGAALPFATIALDTGRVVGSTRFAHIDALNRRAEIGWTWVALPWQRTAVNTEAKLLMLTHAFETWGCIRVEFKTDALNERSRRAILRLGALEEGTLRRHLVTASGRVRDTVYYSILDSEWASVKRDLVQRLEHRG